MNRGLFRTVRTLIVLIIGVVLMAGCDGDSTTGPSNTGNGSPTLPDAAMLDFNFGFFESAQGKEAPATKTNFFNAVIRVAAIQAVTRIVLTPPVAAFALAVHTIPSPQPDGSYIWVFTHVIEGKDVQIRLRGLEEEDEVFWELRINAPYLDEPIDNELWFDGETQIEGDGGAFRFYDFSRIGKPHVATIEWVNEADSEELIFTDYDENPGNELSWHRTGSDCRIDYLDYSESGEWFIRWDEDDGSGSLMVEDYNNGNEACWNHHQDDVDCTPAR